MSDKRPRRMVRGWEGVFPFLPYRRTQLRKMVEEGRLKPPIKIGPRAIAFFEDDLIAAQEALARESDKSD